jgi:hypothetical protein
MGRGGAQRPVLHVNEPKKDGCAQRTGAHARPKPTSLYIYLFLRNAGSPPTRYVAVRIRNTINIMKKYANYPGKERNYFFEKIFKYFKFYFCDVQTQMM